MMLALIPSMMFANSVVPVTVITITSPGPGTTGVKGDTIKVLGGGVSAGTPVQLYWDDVTIAWNGVKGLMNSTAAASDGTYEVWFDIPEATAGAHYIWVKDANGNVASVGLTVNPRIKLSSSSGQPGDTMTINFYGFKGSADLKIVYRTGELLKAGGTGTATWATTPALSGSRSVALATGSDPLNGYGCVNIPITPVALSTSFPEPSYMVYEPTLDAAFHHPYINILLNLAGTSSTPDAAIQGTASTVSGNTVPVNPAASTWTEMITVGGYYGIAPYTLTSPGTLVQCETAFVAAYPSAKVVGIQIRFGNWGEA